MAVSILNETQKLDIYHQVTNLHRTLTRVGEAYGVSRKTIRRVVDEIEQSLKKDVVEQKQGEVFEFQVGDLVTIKEDSKYYGLHAKMNPKDKVGVITKIAAQGVPNHITVTWDENWNWYQREDLEFIARPVTVEEVEEEIGVDYFLQAPQDSITIIRVEKGQVETRNINKTATNFQKLRDMLKGDQSNKTLRTVFLQMDFAKGLEAFTVGRIKVDPSGETVVLIKPDGSERKVPEDLAQDIIETVRNNSSDQDRLIKFLDKLMNNPSFRSIEGLYRFMKHNCITINEDGSIEAWKGVQRNLYSKRAGSIKNSPTCPVADDGRIFNGNFGIEIRVDRSEVNDDPDHSCSHGLHVGNKEYASSWAETLLKVRVEPQDVVAVPKDYNGAKMRCCAYTPICVA